MTRPYAWLGDVDTFLETPEDHLLSTLSRFARETGSPQLVAWDRSLRVLRDELRSCLPGAAKYALVLEFELPRSGGRRPDLIVLENGTVLVIEFKNRVQPEASDFDQVLGYARDLAEYHAGCHGRHLVPILVPIGSTDDPSERGGVHVVGPKGLGALIRRLAKIEGSRGDATRWVVAPYEPLPALIEAARLLFHCQPLPRIKRAESASIPETVAFLEHAIEDTTTRGDRLLALLTGVPGSGKTLAGLQIAHSDRLSVPAIFLSGNGPLVQVLRYSLQTRSGAFIQDMRGFLKTHGPSSGPAPRERVVVFDEAQRAWDRDRVLKKHHGELTGSEPELLVRIAERATRGFVVVALVGEGQEIHAGEEAGIGQWAEALSGRSNWRVIGPSHLAAFFQNVGVEFEQHRLLSLTTTLRSHRASDVALWAGLLLQGKLDEAARVSADLHQAGFPLRVSRNLDALRTYVRDRCRDEPSKRFGILASSKFRKVVDWGVRTPPHRFFNYGVWFEGPPDDPRSGCALDVAISEFGCQGLELDLPLVCWGPDCRWAGSTWATPPSRNRDIRDPRRLRLNAYRVLLTRGRDGVVVFVPPTTEMDSTFDALLAGGFRGLE